MDIHEIISEYGLDDTEQLELSVYIANRFADCEEIAEPDMAFLRTWDSIINYSDLFGAAKAINTKICQMRQVQFNSPDKVRINMFESFAGKIPIIYVSDTGDFEQLVTNIAYKGVRPDGLEKTGASFISGKTTRFIILSSKPYSNVPADELGLDDADDWLEKSMLLRRGHECTHYFTKQNYGIMNNILHDEVMADFIGMYEAFGFYKAEWFLRFMGIVKGSGDRLTFYTNDLSPKVCRAVAEIVTLAAYRLEEWSETEEFKALTVPERIRIVCGKGLAGMIQN